MKSSGHLYVSHFNASVLKSFKILRSTQPTFRTLSTNLQRTLSLFKLTWPQLDPQLKGPVLVNVCVSECIHVHVSECEIFVCEGGWIDIVLCASTPLCLCGDQRAILGIELGLTALVANVFSHCTISSVPGLSAWIK